MTQELRRDAPIFGAAVPELRFLVAERNVDYSTINFKAPLGYGYFVCRQRACRQDV